MSFFFLNEITSYATILLFINSISTVTLSLVKKKCDKWILFLLPQFDIYVTTSAKYLSVKGQLHL